MMGTARYNPLSIGFLLALLFFPIRQFVVDVKEKREEGDFRGTQLMIAKFSRGEVFRKNLPWEEIDTAEWPFHHS